MQMEYHFETHDLYSWIPCAIEKYYLEVPKRYDHIQVTTILWISWVTARKNQNWVKNDVLPLC